MAGEVPKPPVRLGVSLLVASQVQVTPHPYMPGQGSDPPRRVGLGGGLESRKALLIPPQPKEGLTEKEVRLYLVSPLRGRGQVLSEAFCRDVVQPVPVGLEGKEVVALCGLLPDGGSRQHEEK